eukprot:1162041-Pelagomonas_calceolata.AAC.7
MQSSSSGVSGMPAMCACAAQGIKESTGIRRAWNVCMQCVVDRKAGAPGIPVVWAQCVAEKE